MKKTIVSLAVMVIAALSVTAQQTHYPMKQKHHRQSMHHGDERIAKKLNFSDLQKEQLKNINSDYHKKLADLKQLEDITVKESKLRRAALHKAHKAQMQSLLTTAQKDQLATMKQQRIEMAKVKAGVRAEKMKIKLGLTDAQTSQLKNVRTDMATRMKSIRADNSLSGDQKREEFKRLALQQKDQLKTILTPEQLQQMEQMKKQHQKRNFAK